MKNLSLGLLKSLTRTTAIVGKEITEVVRRPGILLSLVLGPFIIMGIFGLGYSGQYQPLNTILVIPPDANLPRDEQFYEQAAGNAIHIVQISDDAQAARQRLVRQEVDLVVIAPANPQAQFQAGQQSAIGVEFNQIDPVRDNYARFVAYRQVQELNKTIIEQAASQGLQYAQQTTGQSSPIPPQVIAAPTTGEVSNIAPVKPSVIDYFAPAVLALILQHMAVTLTALSFVRERLSGTMDLFRVAPVRSVELLLGKYVAYALFNLMVAGLVAFLLIRLLGIPLLGTPEQFTGVVLLLTFASLGLGLLISTTVDSERQAVQLSMLVLLASVFFSGFVLPLEEFLPAARGLAYAIPVTHGIRLMQDAMLRGFTNAPWELVALAGIGLVLFLASSLTIRRSMASA